MRLSRTRQRIIVSILVFCGFAHISSGVTGENNLQYVLQRYVESCGGRAEFQKLKSVRIIGRIDFKGGESCSVVILQKRPNMVRVALDYGKQRVTQVYDGDTAWWMRESDGGVEHFRMQGQMEKNFVRDAPIANALINRDIEGVKLNLGPDERISGNNCFRIDVTFPDGWQSVHYLSKETYREVRIVKKNPQGAVENIIVPSRFEIIDRILFSMRINQMNEKEEVLSTMVIETVETNIGLLNTAFVPHVELGDSP